MITKPLDLESHLQAPPSDWGFLAWVNVGLIALFFGLLGSRFILAPGVEMQVGAVNASLDIPTAGASASGTTAASVVVSYRRDGIILFEGGMYSLPELRKQLEAYVKINPGAAMLVRVDKQVSMQAFLDFCDMVELVGFSRVIVASETPSKPGLGK